ncbi:hypothetical protein SSCHL_2312 [Staphylococcus schleiferi]|uniref:General stress protein n=1 Tax=Staphylococcus coagulans TaxID=74706 RepID=A0A9X0PFQ5_9STAP|nr:MULTISPECIES: general stress protein [Staphylococcus]NHA37242.1 hypothetical protein [Staphylococcus schleiferi]MBA8771985.1 general stress protein [Staphylococcus coagulans]MBA8776816.1 general stress protein [Staphylococcus coagulans]MDR5603317.1 general stress protein [Staphylococcus coagulans]MDR9833157.1 general stress protein [Staphylococcus coagulans]
MALYKVEKYKVARTEDDAIQYVDLLLKEGLKESEIVVLSREKLKTDRFNDSQIQHKSTNGTVSDKFMRFFIGEDAEEAALSKYNFSENEREDLKQDIVNNKIIIIAQRVDHECNEVPENNAAYQTPDDDKHAPSEHKGDIE